MERCPFFPSCRSFPHLFSQPHPFAGRMTSHLTPCRPLQGSKTRSCSRWRAARAALATWWQGSERIIPASPASRRSSDHLHWCGEQGGIELAHPAQRPCIDDQVGQRVEVADGVKIAYFGSLDAQFFGPTVDALGAGALVGEPVTATTTSIVTSMDVRASLRFPQHSIAHLVLE